MLNEEKVKSMTKAAAYEKGPEKKNIEISSYFRGDYLGLQMLKSAVAYTVAFCILATLWMMGRMTELMLMISRVEYLNRLMKLLILLFVSGLVFYEIAVYAYYSVKYQKARRSLKGYDSQLKTIHKFYVTQESADEPALNSGEADEENTL